MPTQVPAAEAVTLGELVDYAPDSVVSRVIEKGPAGSITILAFDSGETISEHTTPCNASAYVLEGCAEFVVGGKAVRASQGQMVALPANVGHSINATERFKMLLVMLRA